MNKIALLALAASSAAIATPSMAATGDVTGTITITGTVASKCSVGPVAGPNTATWGTAVAMGELADANGTLLPSTTLEATFASQANGLQNARVVCSGATGKISVDADPLVNATTAPANYADTVHFQADVLVDKNTVADQTYSNDSAAAAGSLTAIGDYLNPSVASNVTVTTSNWRTLTAGALLVAGNYNNGKIVITITPS